MKICFLSTQAFSVSTLHHLKNNKNYDVHVVSISPNLAQKHKVYGYLDYKNIAKQLELPFFTLNSFNIKNQDDIAYFYKKKFDIILTLGWNRILTKEILNSSKFGAIGSHSSPLELPFGRGRSPVVWSIALGFRKLVSQLFHIDEGVDTGKILAFRELAIDIHDTTQTMYYKIAVAQSTMIDEAITRIQNSQEFTKSSYPELYFPKRGPEDAMINWEKGAKSLHDLVRSVSAPFHGAFFFHQNKKVTLWKASIWNGPEIYGEVGEITAIFDNDVALVQTGQGQILLLEHTSSNFELGEILN